ncbi:MAG TPA: hypothetical protein H9669_08820 [Firmicutes bacterium]|nr:hypothetical protein [Bacillota bacterium]
MDSNAAEEQFYELAARFFGRQRNSLGENTRFRRDLKADSLDRLSFVLATESCFRCHLNDDGLAFVKTLGDFWRVVAAALGIQSVCDTSEILSAKHEIFNG